MHQVVHSTDRVIVLTVARKMYEIVVLLPNAHIYGIMTFIEIAGEIVRLLQKIKYVVPDFSLFCVLSSASRDRATVQNVCPVNSSSKT